MSEPTPLQRAIDRVRLKLMPFSDTSGFDFEEIVKQLEALQVELETAKADRNKAALHERQKCLPQLEALEKENEELKRLESEWLINDRDSLKSALEAMTKERDELKQRLLELSDSPQGDFIVERQKLQGCERQLKETEVALESMTRERDEMENELSHNALILLSFQTQRDEAKEQLESTRAENAKMREALKVIWADCRLLRVEWFEKQGLEMCMAVINNIRKHSDIGLSTPPTNADNSKEGK